MFCKHLLVYINSKVPFHENMPPLPSHRSGVPECNVLILHMKCEFYDYFSETYRFLTIKKTCIVQTASRSRNNFHSPFVEPVLFLLLVTLVSWQFSSLKLVLTLNPTHLACSSQRKRHFPAVRRIEPPTT